MKGEWQQKFKRGLCKGGPLDLGLKIDFSYISTVDTLIYPNYETAVRVVLKWFLQALREFLSEDPT